jgi:CheY-like chemotaxis protein
MSARAAAAPQPEVPQAEPAIKPRTARRHALVVDDNPDITAMLSAVLRLAGYDVSVAHSAPEALEAALARPFDVVISDVGMPGMNGYELARALRSVPGYGATPMVAVTGFAMYDDRDRATEAGFDTHLSKPINPVDLTQAISGMWH